MIDGQDGPGLCERFDAVLFDLDGVIYIGPAAVPHAIESVTAVGARGPVLVYVTNNANRPPEAVATHLRSLGLDATRTDVVTSPQAAVSLLPERIPDGSPVLVVGGPGIDDALAERGYRPVHDRVHDPVAVLQGFSPDLTWRDLAQACYAVEAGLLWIATNPDRTIPTPEGIAPGNGAFVDLVARIAGRQPDAVAGKPEPPLLREAIARAGSQRPLMVGDRLDTDIEAGTRAGVATLLVMTGVTSLADLLSAPPEHRPDFVGADLRVLLAPYPAPQVDGEHARCGEVAVRRVDDRVQVDATGPLGQVAHAAALLVWRARDCGARIDIEASAAAILAAVRPGTVDPT